MLTKLAKKSLLSLLLLLVFATGFSQQSAASFMHLSYDKGENNWLNLFQAPSHGKTPVLIWAHANGGSPKGFPKPLLDSLMGHGISVVNWESIPTLLTPEDVFNAQKDFYTVFAWVKANAAKYNFDTANIFVSGASRGTVISFEGVSNLGPQIKGAYFVEALPMKSWLVEDFTKMVKPHSPTLTFSYANPFGSSNAHTPDNGLRIVEQYKKLGIGDKVTLYQNLGKEHIYERLVPFILSRKTNSN